MNPALPIIDGQFMGYSVHLEETDEFLAGMKTDNPDVQLWQFVKSRPYMAMRFSSYEKACDIAEDYGKHGATPVAIYDTEDQFIVVSCDK